MKKATLFGMLSVLLIVISGCSSNPKIKTEPFFEEFYEKARLIMSKEETEIYKNLPSAEAAEEFIADFWMKRDPNPETEENEAMEEFQRRIDFANRWFRETGVNRGWNTDRGRLLLTLGFPDKREWGSSAQYIPGGQKVMDGEIWYYSYYQMYLYFIDETGTGRFNLLSWDPAILASVESSKEYWGMEISRKRMSRLLKFDLEYKDGKLLLEIPIKRLSFNEDGDNVVTEFRYWIKTYLDYNKIDEVENSKTITKSQDEFLSADNFVLPIIYNVDQPGKYLIEVTLEDTIAGTKYRKFLKVKK